MVQTLTPAELAARLAVDAGDLDVVDVRDRAEWDAGHIAGSRALPLEELRADPEAVLRRGAALVFVCAKGVRSMQAAKLAERFGYERVYSLGGGTKAWAASGGELASALRAAA